MEGFVFISLTLLIYHIILLTDPGAYGRLVLAALAGGPSAARCRASQFFLGVCITRHLAFAIL